MAQLDGTPSKPEIVLNANDSKNFLELRDFLRAMSEEKLTIGSSYKGYTPLLRGITDISDKVAQIQKNIISNSQTITFGDTNINIDHVEDYNDFVNQLRNDSKFEKMIQAMTIDRIAGNSSLSKYKYNWNK